MGAFWTLLKSKANHTFIRFSLVGGLWTVVNIGTDVLFVDVLGLAGWLGTLISYVLLYIGRYYTYILFNVIQRRFWKYVYSTVAFTFVMWILKIVAIDVLHFDALYASPVITSLAFILKYFLYRSIDLLHPPSDRDPT